MLVPLTTFPRDGHLGKRANMTLLIRSLLTLMSLVLLLAACTPDDDATDEATESGPAPTTSGPPEATPSEVSESPTIGLVRCENPDGFSIGYPDGWQVNSGEVVPPCSQFNPESFEVPRGTDERVAAITAFVDPVPYERVAAPSERRDAAREEMTISGQPAVRLEHQAGPNSIWPEGTPITTYMIKMPPADEREQTLIVDTIGLSPFDYERNQEVLEQMAQTIEISA